MVRLRIIEVVQIAALSLVCFLLANFDAEQIISYPDTSGYLSVASSMTQGKYFQSAEASEIMTAMRSPLYPLMLALAGMKPYSVLLLHFLIGTFAVTYVSVALRRVVNPFVASTAISLSLARVEWINAVMPEWLMINLILMIYVTAGLLIIEPNRRRIVLLCVLVGAGILTHPAMFVLLFIAILGIAVSLWKGSKQGVIEGTLIMATAIVAIVGINMVRFGEWSLTPFGNLHRFGIAAVIGEAAPTEGDSPKLTEFLTEMNRNRIRFDFKNSDPVLLHTNQSTEAEKYLDNIWVVGETIRSKLGLSNAEFNEFAAVYSIRVLRNHTSDYGRYVLSGLRGLFHDFSFFTAGLLLALIAMIARNRAVPLAGAVLISIVIHGIHAILCCSTLQYVNRFYDRTFLGFKAVVVLLAILITAELFRALSLFRPLERLTAALVFFKKIETVENTGRTL